MDSSQDSVVEVRLEEAVRQAWKQLLKDIRNEPTLVIESDDNEAISSAETATAIRDWLFKRG